MGFQNLSQNPEVKFSVFIFKVRGIEAYRFRPPKSVYDMRNPDNYCYCPEFNDCVSRSDNETDEWITEDCFEDCKDGFLR